VIAELGHFALIAALLVAIVQMAVPLAGARFGWSDWMALAVPAALAQAALIALAFGALTHAFVTSDFSVALVAANSHSLKPMLYKVTGVWGNHEGSLLLWVLILALFGATVALFGGNLPASLKARVLGVQASIGVAFLGFLLFTSNPFLRLANPPFDGQDLNPLLQDPGLAFHPPFLYLGYVGLSMAFSFAVAALIEGRVDAAWARWVRPWTLAAWVFLTVGIGLGSWWAYYELGWGGFWFWDPVENASFMPWLLSAALLHSAIVVEKREALKSWTILLAILAFSFSLIGTFIVRSGVLTSVHAFASDPTRGTFILAILVLFTGGALTLYAARASALGTAAVFGAVSRESGLVLNNLLLSVAAMVVFVGTIWPLLAEMAWGAKVSVGPFFFNMAFAPFMVLLAALLPLGAMLPWKRARAGRAMRPLWGPLALALALGGLAFAMQTGRNAVAPLAVALGTWVVLGAAVDLALRIRLGGVPVGESLRRAAALPRADWGKAVGHAGFGITVFAVAAIWMWKVEVIAAMAPGDTLALGRHTLRLDGVTRIDGPNYAAERATVVVIDDGAEGAVLHPEKRFYPVQAMPTTEAGIERRLTRDIYVALGDRQPDGRHAVRAWIKPFANWVWAGAIIMALGGILSLTDRRYRVGAAARRMAQVPAE
jgi:cytochrome c-type biogenesis protein CcmF